MNRKEEYWALIGGLGDIPPELDGTVDRAKARAKRAGRGRWLGIPVASLAGLASAFALLVNCSLPFAMACRRIPVVRELAEAVAMNPSLKAAFEHDYIQPVGQTQSKDGITLSVEYLIADEKQIHVFYTLTSQGDTLAESSIELLDASGQRRKGYVATWGDGGPGRDEEEYLTATLHFVESLPAEDLVLRFEIRDSGHSKAADGANEAPADASNGPWVDAATEQKPTILATFDFPLTIDRSLLGPGRIIEVGTWMELDGQQIYVDQLAIDPTSMILTLGDHPDNTAWLTGLTCHITDENGAVYERQGISLGGTMGKYFWPNYSLDSPYFTDATDFTLVITKADWMDKGNPSITLDLTTGQADWLPGGLTIQDIERRNGDIYLTVGNNDQAVRFGTYHDPQGGEHDWDGYSASAIDRDEDGYCETLTEYRVLRDYPWDSVVLELYSSRQTELDTPLELPLF